MSLVVVYIDRAWILANKPWHQYVIKICMILLKNFTEVFAENQCSVSAFTMPHYRCALWLNNWSFSKLEPWTSTNGFCVIPTFIFWIVRSTCSCMMIRTKLFTQQLEIIVRYIRSQKQLYMRIRAWTLSKVDAKAISHVSRNTYLDLPYTFTITWGGICDYSFGGPYLVLIPLMHALHDE